MRPILLGISQIGFPDAHTPAVCLTLDRDMGKPVDVLMVKAQATANQVRGL